MGEMQISRESEVDEKRSSKRVAVFVARVLPWRGGAPRGGEWRVEGGGHVEGKARSVRKR